MKIEAIKELSVKEGENPNNIVETLNTVIRSINSLSNKNVDLGFNLKADVVTVTTGVGLNIRSAWEIKNKFFPAIPKAVFIGKFLPQNVASDYFTDTNFTPAIWWDLKSGNSIVEVTYSSPYSSPNKAEITLIILY